MRAIYASAMCNVKQHTPSVHRLISLEHNQFSFRSNTQRHLVLTSAVTLTYFILQAVFCVHRSSKQIPPLIREDNTISCEIALFVFTQLPAQSQDFPFTLTQHIHSEFWSRMSALSKLCARVLGCGNFQQVMREGFVFLFTEVSL